VERSPIPKNRTDLDAVEGRKLKLPKYLQLTPSR
jgi:hypothetical protein